MIKFVCATCQERLSVPEQFAGRKGACPSCGSINRVPLRGFAESQGTTIPRAVASTSTSASQSSRITAPAARTNGVAHSNGVAHTNGHLNGNGTGSNGHTTESNGAVGVMSTSFVDRRGRVEPAVAPTLPVSRMTPKQVPDSPAPVEPAGRTAIPPVSPVRVEIPRVAPPAAQPVAETKPIKRAKPPAPTPVVAAPASQPVTAPKSASGSVFGLSFIDAAVAALPELPAETHEPVYAQRHALAADQLTPGERWKQAFAAEDAQPKSWTRFIPLLGRSQSSAATGSAAVADVDDDSIPMAVKLGLLIVGTIGITGAIYAIFHLMLWASTGVK